MANTARRQNVAIAVDARRGEVYFQLFGTASGAPQLLPVATAAGQCQGQAVVLAGTGAALLMPHLTDAVRSVGPGLPDAVAVARLAARRDPSGSPPDPLYIRAPDARLPAPEITRADFTAAPVLAALHAECFSAPWSADDFATLAGSPGAVALIGRLRGEPAGFVLARQAAGEIEILTIGTRPAFRRKGIARALAAALIERVTEGAGGAVIFIEVATGTEASRRGGEEGDARDRDPAAHGLPIVVVRDRGRWPTRDTAPGCPSWRARGCG